MGYRGFLIFTMDGKTAIKIIEISYLVTYGKEISEKELKHFLERLRDLEIINKE